jgi:hypothetical protein
MLMRVTMHGVRERGQATGDCAAWRVAYEQIAAKYPDCEKQRRIFLAKVSDDPRFMAYDHRARVRRLDDIAQIVIMCTQPQRTRLN